MRLKERKEYAKIPSLSIIRNFNYFTCLAHNDISSDRRHFIQNNKVHLLNVISSNWARHCRARWQFHASRTVIKTRNQEKRENEGDEAEEEKRKGVKMSIYWIASRAKEADVVSWWVSPSSLPATTEPKCSLYFISRPFDLIGPHYRALLPRNFHFWCQKTNISRARRSGGLRRAASFATYFATQSALWLRWKKTSWSINRMMESFPSFPFSLTRARSRSIITFLSHHHASTNANARASPIESITRSDDSSRMISTTVTVHSAEHNLRVTRFVIYHGH